MTILRRFFAVLALLSVFAFGAAGCKQSKGERCQLASDCECGECVIVSGLEGLCCEGVAVTDGAVADAPMSTIDATVPDAMMSVLDGASTD